MQHATLISDEQRELIRAVQAFLDKRSPEAEVRRLMEAGGAADPAVWAQIAQQLGLQGLAIPERYGGGGFGYLDLALVAECVGAALLVAPLLSTVAAAGAINFSDDEKLKSAYLPALASGDLVATLAFAEDSGRWDAASVTTTAATQSAAAVLTGTKMYVLDAMSAGALVVSARSAAGVGLYIVDARAPGVTVSAMDALDLTRPLGRVDLAGAPARPIVAGGPVSDVVDRVLAVAVTLLAAEQVGGAQRCLDMAVEYAKVRVQFGRPIGSFQAIKHKCADMLYDVESARSAAYHAASSLDNSHDSRAEAALAQAHCSAAYSRVAAENIQIHGGIGFTWEHPAQLHYKRAKSSELLFGDPAAHRERLGELLGI
ncbi:MAG: acyl-CoA dehydrogenase [Mycobacterium sp.]|nr:MAG: acyl-CoA dehydrogenase [Mycobacterium sp.]